jgi:hypothetical protein
VNFRLKNFLVSVVFPFLVLLFLRITNTRLEGFVLYGTIFVAIATQYFLNFWLYNFNVFPQGFITILLLPSIWFASFILIFVNFIVQLHSLYEIMIIGAFLTLQYYFSTTQNILNLSHFKNISLSQAAFTTNHFYTVLTFFTSNLAVFLLPDLSYVLKLASSLVLFIIIIIIFALLNNVQKIQYTYAIVLYAAIIYAVGILYIFNFIMLDRLPLIVIALSIIFREIIILILYYARKVLNPQDYIYLALETFIVAGIFYYSTF